MSKILDTKEQEKVWAAICNAMVTDRPFRTQEAAKLIAPQFQWSVRTAEQKILATLKAVMADHEKRPQDYDGHIPVQKHGQRAWVL